jgi:hypothetical protein
MDDQTPTAEGPPAPDSREAAARLFEEAAAEPDRASAPCRRAAEQFRGRRGAAGRRPRLGRVGHLREAEQGLEAQARAHRLRSSV